MIDYKCLIEIYRDGHEIHTDTVITIEEDIDIALNPKDEDQDIEFEKEQLTRDILLEKLKEEFDEDVELIEFEELTDRDYHIYKLTY